MGLTLAAAVARDYGQVAAPPAPHASPRPDQAFQFGRLPTWADALGRALDVSHWPRALRARRPLFDMLALNTYPPGTGLTPHVDLAQFEDGVAIVSLGSPVVMRFEPLNPAAAAHVRGGGVLLGPGDVLTLCGEARHQFTHGFPAVTADKWAGRAVARGWRLGLTLRRMRPPEG